MPGEADQSLDDPAAAEPDRPPRHPQEERVACEHAERCGGCPLIGLSYADQLVHKHTRVAQSAMRYASLALTPPGPVAPARPLVGYRVRAKLIVAAGGKIGLFARGGGHHVIDIPSCRVLAPSLGRVAATLRALVLRAEIDVGALAPFDPAGRGCLRAIDLREVLDGETTRVLVTFVVQRERVSSLESLEQAARDLMQDEQAVAGVACNFHDGDAPQVLGAETVPLAGATSATDRVGPSTHFATFGSFVQVHRAQAGRVHTLLADAFGLAAGRTKPRVLDLYGGSGAIALGLAARGARVHLVECFAPAASQARAAAENLGVQVEVQCADAAAALRALAQHGERFDAVVVNPPRRGTAPASREWLARLGPPIIAYVSCDPETLARDLDHFARLGYATTSLHPIDMIPLTDEVETVAFLKRSIVPAPRAVYEDQEVIVVDKGAHEPTAPQGEYGGSLFTRVRRVTGAENAVPVHRLDVGASGLVLFARRAEFVAKWQRALASAKARTIYLVAARGITPVKGTVTRDRGKASPGPTRYSRLAVAGGHSILRVIPELGGGHQIRRHLAAIGHPLLGDDRYGHATTNRFFDEKNGLDRPFLHAARLEFDHPNSHAPHVIESDLPGDLRMVLERMGAPSMPRLLDSA